MVPVLARVDSFRARCRGARFSDLGLTDERYERTMHTMTTYYIIDADANQIINAVETTSQERAQEVADRMQGAFRVTACPSPWQLQNYRYWNERP